MRVENQLRTRVLEDSRLCPESSTKYAVQEFHLRLTFVHPVDSLVVGLAGLSAHYGDLHILQQQETLLSSKLLKHVQKKTILVHTETNRIAKPSAQLYSLAETPQTSHPPAFGALLVSQDRRHLFVTPCIRLSTSFFGKLKIWFFYYYFGISKKFKALCRVK
jgi:hypothetical protein